MPSYLTLFEFLLCYVVCEAGTSDCRRTSYATNSVELNGALRRRTTDLDKCDTTTQKESLKAYNLTLPFIKSFSVSIGHPKGFNVTFLDDFTKFVVMEFYGCLNEKDTRDKTKIMYDMCIIVPNENNDHAVEWVYYNQETELKTGDEIFFRLCVMELTGYKTTINRGYFRVI